MPLRINPRDTINSMVAGEDYAFELSIVKELSTKTVNSYTYKIYSSSDVEVTDTFGGGSLNSSGVITFGIKAISTGKYTLKFIITCNEMLPDGITPYKFYVELFANIS